MKFVLLFFLSLLIACSAKDLVVKNADHLLSYQISKRIPLRSDQKDLLKKDIDLFLQGTKPKAQELVPVFDEIDLNDTEKLHRPYTILEKFYLQLTGDFSDLLARHLAKLDQKQQKEMFKTLDAENRDIQKRDAESLKEKVEERMEQILGPINKKQKQMITDHLDYFIQRNKDRWQRRAKLHHELNDIYKTITSIEARKEVIKEAIARYQDETIKGNKNLELLKKIAPTLSDSQKGKLREHLKEVKRLINYYLSVEY
jgi:hypothetical protein